MSMPKNELQEKLTKAWDTYLEYLEKSVALLESQIEEAKEMSVICTDEWCQATEHYIEPILAMPCFP